MEKNSQNKKKKVIAITRPFNRIDEAVKIIEENNAEVFIAPTLELELVNSHSLKKLVEDLEKLDWLIFTSVSSLDSIFKFYPDFKEKLTDKTKIVAIGTKTKEKANEYGLVIDLVPKDFTAEGILKAMENFDIKDNLIGIPRTLSARHVLPHELKNRGAKILIAESYKSVLPLDVVRIETLITKIINNEIDAITFTSPLTVKNLFKVVTDNQKDELIAKLSNYTLTVAIGPITYKILDDLGITAYYPDNYTVKDMLNLLFENLVI
ncbi:MAG: uroporphyrinogen-III synthase [Methanobrevibacter sp.]|jgi:uroporphyrinogen-III synthase|nr:uroporphyrinogen-III synthase [Candidatus Methanoflexus mossambicus]